jgi:hypothetical protein
MVPHGLSQLTSLGHHAFPNVWISPLNLVMLALVLGSVFVAPNTEEVMRRYGGSLGVPRGLESAPRTSAAFAWMPSIFWGVGLGAVAAVSILLLMHPHVFLYYNF